MVGIAPLLALRALLDKVDAFDNICLRRILCIPYMDHV